MKINFDALMMMLRAGLSAKFGDDAWLTDANTDRCIMCQEGKYYEVPYMLSADEKSVTLGDRGAEVKSDYVPLAELTGIEIFAVGTHRGQEYTHAHLDEMVGNFVALGSKIKPTLVVGHSEDQKLLADSGIPSAGWASGVRKVGDKLLADFKDVPEVLAELIKRGAYKRVSSEIYTNFKDGKKAVGHALRRVAILGGEIPEVKTLQDVAALYADGQPTAWVNFDEVDVEKPTKEDTKMDEKEIQQLKEEKAAADARAKKAEDELVKLSEEKAASDKAARRASVEAKVEGLVKQGKLTPAMKPGFVCLMETLGESGVIKFGEKDVQPVDLFEEVVIKNLGVAVKLGEQAATGKDAPIDETQKTINKALGVSDEDFAKFAEKED